MASLVFVCEWNLSHLLNSLLSLWWKSSHKHCKVKNSWTTLAISTFDLLLWRWKHYHALCKLHMNNSKYEWSLVVRLQKCDVSLSMWKLKNLLLKAVMSLVALWLQISRHLRKFLFIWRKLLFFGVLFCIFSHQKRKYSLTGNRPAWRFRIRITSGKTVNNFFILIVSYLDLQYLNRNEETL